MTTEPLPLPPSANAMYHMATARGRRIPTDIYTRWRYAAAILCRVSLDAMAPRTPLAVTILVAASRRRDVDNIIKPVLDMLQHAGIIPDDRWVDEIIATRISPADDTMTIQVATV